MQLAGGTVSTASHSAAAPDLRGAPEGWRASGHESRVIFCPGDIWQFNAIWLCAEGSQERFWTMIDNTECPVILAVSWLRNRTVEEVES